jgi:hypothetical protein
LSDYLDELDRRGIDPTATFYTELPMMDGLLDRLEGKQREKCSCGER